MAGVTSVAEAAARGGSYGTVDAPPLRWSCLVYLFGFGGEGGGVFGMRPVWTGGALVVGVFTSCPSFAIAEFLAIRLLVFISLYTG